MFSGLLPSDTGHLWEKRWLQGVWYFSPENSVRPTDPRVYEQQTANQRSERRSATPTNEGNADGNKYDLEREREFMMHGWQYLRFISTFINSFPAIDKIFCHLLKTQRFPHHYGVFPDRLQSVSEINFKNKSLAGKV